jgi:two-component system OmpR family response regulator
VNHCLLVEDDAEIRQLVASYLRSYGLAVTAVATAAEMRRALKPGAVDVVLLDLMLPDANGLDLCREVRGSSQVPIIMLTAQGDPVSRVIGLELGADDYLGKPFEPRELVARVHAVLRRTGPRQTEEGEQAVARFRGWTFHRVKRQLTAPDQTMVALSGAEFRLLSVLVDHAGQVLSRERLLQLTRTSEGAASDRSVDLAVSRLRHKLRDAGQGNDLIRTMRGEGYLFAPKPGL